MSIEYKPIPNIINVDDIQMILETNRSLEQENERLNNIINKLESYLKYNIETENPFYIKDTYEIVLNRLQELKGDSSNV